MRQLTIEYLLEGHQRGYNFTSSTQGFNDDTLKAVWRSAMPRGQGWGADVYKGAHSLKSFLVADGRIALSDVTVTDMRDESGRAGIRRAEVKVMQPGEYAEYLLNLLRTYPAPLQTEIHRKPGFLERKRIPRVKGERQVILSHPYIHAQNWQLIEALVVKAALDELSGWAGRIVPFTTLALEYREESQLVVLPEAKAQTLTNLNTISI